MHALSDLQRLFRLPDRSIWIRDVYLFVCHH